MELPVWLDTELWEDFKQHRKELRKPLTSVAEKMAIKKIQRLSVECNCSPRAIIEQTLENGWMGFFHLKVDHNARTRQISGGNSATAEARRLQAEGFRTGFEDEDHHQPALPSNVVNLR